MWEVAGGILSTSWGSSTGASLLWHEGMLVFPAGAWTSAVNPTTKSTFRGEWFGLGDCWQFVTVGAARRRDRWPQARTCATQSFFAALRSSSNTKRRTWGSSYLARDGPSTDERRAAAKLFEDRQVPKLRRRNVYVAPWWQAGNMHQFFQKEHCSFVLSN